MKTTAVLIVVAGVCAAAGARPCEQHEKCVALTHCPSLRRLAAKGAGLAEADKAALRAAQCGWAPGEAAMSTAPQVCCPLLPLDECALPNPDRLIFSTAVRVFEAPWLARLAYRSEEDSLEYGCSASLVTDLYLVTAAHCVVPRAPVSVRLGELDTETDPDCSDIPGGLLCAAPALDVAVDSVIAHPEYAASDARNDIALVRLRHAVGFTDDVRPVCLPVAGVVVPPPKGHRVLVVHGWGSQANNGSANRLMTKGQQLEVLVDVCAARPLAARPFDAEVQLCTAPKHRSNACRGDLGGSLTAAYVRAGSDQGPVETLVGVLSFGGDACGNETAPTASTRVAAFVPWILAGLGDGGSVH